MLNENEFYAINCILNYSSVKTDYDRFLAFNNEGKPFVLYKDSSLYPHNIARYLTKDDALKSIKAVLDMEAPDEWSTHDIINLLLVRNSNKYTIAICKIEDNKVIKISESKIAELDRHW